MCDIREFQNSRRIRCLVGNIGNFKYLDFLYIKTLLLFFSFIIFTGNAGAEAQKVLVIHSYHTGFPSTPSYIDEINKGFGADYHVEDIFLDTKRVDPQEAFRLGYHTLSERLKDNKPDLVLTFDDNALIFADLYRDILFPAAPVLFAAVNNRNRVIEMAAKENTTGFLNIFLLIKRSGLQEMFILFH